MKVLLDTNLLVHSPRLSLLRDPENTELLTSALSLAELQEGEFSSRAETRLRAPIDYACAKASLGDGLPFDDHAAMVYRAVCQAIVNSGRQLVRHRRLDMMIAAIAIAQGCTLATRNTDDFRGLEPLLDVIEL